MPTVDNTVRLTVNSTDYAGWKEVSITAGIERVARDFTLSVTDRWPGQKDIPRRIQPFDLCELYIGADKVLTGYVFATPISYDEQQISVGVTGRSKTAQLVDCSATGAATQWRGQSVEAIAAALAKPYGITVRADVATGASVSDHQMQQGETVHESLERLLKARQLWASDDEQGRLIILKVGAQRASTALKVGDNVLTGAAPLDYKDRYSEYVCKGQHAGDDDFFGEAANTASASKTDSHVPLRRTLIVQQSGQATAAACRERVAFEAAYRAAKSLSVTYTVQGWRQADGTLWRPNMLVRVVDPVVGFDNELLISEVEYKLSDGGQIATLQVAPPGAFLRQDEAAVTKKAGKSSGGQWADVQPVGKSVDNKTSKGAWSDVK